MIEKGQTIVYRRLGRKNRNSGAVLVAKDSSGNIKVKPAQALWKCVWLAPGEVAGGTGKPIRKPKSDTPAKEAFGSEPADTPETDAATYNQVTFQCEGEVDTEFARKLERQRDEARDLAELYRNRANESHLPIHRMPWENSREQP